MPLATFHQDGGHCPLLSHKPSLTVSLESLSSLQKGGNMTRLRALRSFFVTRRCCLGALPESAHCFVHKVALWRLSQTLLCPPARSGFSTPTSGCFFCDDFAFLFPCLSHSCLCGRPLDCLGHHRASCSRAGVLGRRGFALESAAARVCGEAGARVSTNIFVRDLDVVAARAEDQRRIEVIAEGLPVFHGAPLRADGEPHRQCLDTDGAALDAVRRRKARTYPELAGGRGRVKLVVLASEIGGRFRWNADVHPSTRARTAPSLKPLRTRAHQSWMHLWGSLLVCAAARAFASSLLERHGQPGADGEAPPAADVLGGLHQGARRVAVG